MSAHNDDDGPAFPGSYQWTNDGDCNNHAPNGMVVPPGGSETIAWAGMSLRDYFAAKAMQAFILNRNNMYATDAIRISSEAYEVADAMLKAR